MTEIDITTPTPKPELSPVIINLLKGVIYQDSDPNLWTGLMQLQVQVREYVKVLGLELVLDEAEGYAFLQSLADPDELSDVPNKLPRLIARRRLSFPVSLLLALLRKRLAESDAGDSSSRLVLSQTEVIGMMRVFLKESSNEARIVDQIDTHVSKVVELGFLRRLKKVRQEDEQTFEVKRILKAFVDAQWLADFDARLAEYATHSKGRETTSNE